MKLSIFLFRLALCLSFFLLPVAPLSAQGQTSEASVLAGASGQPQWSRLEGTLESTVNGVTARAKVFVQGPGQLRLEIQRDDDAQIAPQIIVVSQDETRLFDPVTKRIQRLPHSILSLRGWSLQFGGPANFALANFADGLRLPDKGKLERKGFAQSFVSDYVRFGGGGDRIFYAPFKRTQWDGPARVLLEWKGAGPIQSRTEYDETGRVLSRAALTYDKSGIPSGAVVVDGENRALANFKYALKERAEPFPAETFAFDFTAGQIIEDAQTKAITEYTGADANSKFNRGVALMRQAEEFPAAFAAWEEAAALAPQATGPHFVMYDAALAARDLARAESALKKLGELLGAESFPVVWRRAGILLARRDWTGMQSALETATKIEPQNLQAKLSLADVLRSRGNFEGAQRQLDTILQSESPQPATQVQAAQMRAELVTGKAGAGIPAAGQDAAKQTLWQKVARVVISLRQEQKTPLPETTNLDALGVLAQEYERAGYDDEAQATWRKIVTLAPSPSDQIARAHLMALFARRGDVAGSLSQYRELIAATPDEKTRRARQEQLIGAWSKAFRVEQLKTALEQRSISTNATEDDARLWLTYQEIFGKPEEVSAAIQNGLARFTRDAWWRARHSELLMEQAANSTDTATLDRLQRDALDVAETAIALDPTQPYYAVQRAMILTQRATRSTGLIASGRFDGLKKIASDALDELLKKWPEDADIQIAVASQRLALEADGAHSDSIALLQTALRGGAPSVGEDRHFISFAARQTLISALRRDKKWNELTPQYEILFRVARSGDEQLGVALNYLRLLMSRDEPDGIALLLTHFARESWPFEESQQVLLPLVNVAYSREATLAPTILALGKNPDPYARLVLAKLFSAQARNARAVLAAPEAPDRAERDVVAAESNLKLALEQLEPLVQSDDKILAARAAATLGEEAMNRNEPAEGEKWMSRASVLEPRDVNLRVAVAVALLAQNNTKDALAARDTMLRALPHSFENLSRAAKLSSRISEKNDKEFTARLASQALNMGTIAPEVNIGAWQLAAFTAARASFDAGQLNAANTLYKGLAGPQWSLLERAVALIDVEESYKIAGRKEQAAGAAAQLEALGLTPQQRQRAEEIWAHLGD